MNQKPLNPITAQDIAQFQADGVVCLRGMFDSEWISRMQKAVDRIMDAHNPLARPREVTQALGGTSGKTWSPWHMTMKLASSPSKNSSITTQAPAWLCFTPKALVVSMSSMAWCACSKLVATTTPLPAARPSALTTMGTPWLST